MIKVVTNVSPAARSLGCYDWVRNNFKRFKVMVSSKVVFQVLMHSLTVVARGWKNDRENFARRHAVSTRK